MKIAKTIYQTFSSLHHETVVFIEWTGLLDVPLFWNILLYLNILLMEFANNI